MKILEIHTAFSIPITLFSHNVVFAYRFFLKIGFEETLIFRNAHSQTGVHGVNAVGSVVLMEQKKELVRFDFHVIRSVPRMVKNQF